MREALNFSHYGGMELIVSGEISPPRTEAESTFHSALFADFLMCAPRSETPSGESRPIRSVLNTLDGLGLF